MHTGHDLPDKDTAMICEHLNTCSFINGMSASGPVTANLIKVKYCNSDKGMCARYRLARISSMDIIPNDLWPSDDMKFYELLESTLNETREGLYGMYM